MRIVLALALAMGCVRSTPPQTASEPQLSTSGPVLSQLSLAKWQALPGLSDVTCDTGACTAVVDGRRHTLDPLTLALGPAIDAATPVPPSPQAEGTIPAQEPPVDPMVLAQMWNEMRKRGWRTPFLPRIPAPGGGAITYLRGSNPGQARLVRSGGAMRMAPAPGSIQPAGHERWLALHPTGQEAYLLVWPVTELYAFDPRTLSGLWSIVIPPAWGLFLDPAGRYLIAESGEASDDLVMTDAKMPSRAPDWDPAGDRVLAQTDRPQGTQTLIIDLAARRVAATISGRYLCWVPIGGSSVLVGTDNGVARLTPSK